MTPSSLRSSVPISANAEVQKLPRVVRVPRLLEKFAAFLERRPVAIHAGQLSKVYKELALRTEGVIRQDELTYFAAAIATLFLVGAGVFGTMWSTRLP